MWVGHGMTTERVWFAEWPVWPVCDPWMAATYNTYLQPDSQPFTLLYSPSLPFALPDSPPARLAHSTKAAAGQDGPQRMSHGQAGATLV